MVLACLAAGADAEATGTPQWKGVTWGMLPLHTSGIVACTYHLFYNAPALSWCVALQAGMTCIGNTTLAFACLRLALASGWTWEMGKDDAIKLIADLREQLSRGFDRSAPESPYATAAPSSSASAGQADVASPTTTDVVSAPAASGESALIGWEDLGDAWSNDSDLFFLAKLAALSGGLAYFVKYVPGLVPLPVISAWGSLPDEAVSAAALVVIVVPTLLNCAKWQARSQENADFVGDI